MVGILKIHQNALEREEAKWKGKEGGGVGYCESVRDIDMRIFQRKKNEAFDPEGIFGILNFYPQTTGNV